MRCETRGAFLVLIVAAGLVSGIVAGASAQDQVSRQVKHQKRLLRQQRDQIEQNERRIDAQRRQLGNEPQPGAGVFGGPYAGVPYGYDQYGCPPGTGYSIFLHRCGDMSEFFTQFQGR